MGFDLEGKGGSHEWTGDGWTAVLDLGEQYGWEPAGTGPPKGESSEEWDGDYGSNDGQLFKARDAKKLADALERALADFPDFKWPADSEATETRAWLSTEEGKGGLTEFIAFLRAGSFRIN